ncbi:hypothetical protein NP233_g948 [Leucocoprinus birnbaumii]|uniref:DUF6534 domain-containing protein n=1 Tax=Leucocoprinus birnbaumii TaxID=56174 RepID=A0AAD5W0W9_9AGAR|nr:hypothetical protein NP233_g948 [Leucocoprinus birnbaumii]
MSSTDMPPTSTPLPDNASLILGPPVVGVAINWYLYGILTMQYFMYLNNPRHNDGIFLRGIVHFLFLLDTAQTFMIMDDAFFWFVYHFGDYSAALDPNLASISGPFLDASIAFTVQLVYCWRLWKLGKQRALPIICAILALLSCASGMTTGIHSVLDQKQYTPKQILKEIELWLFSAAITDILIASSMTYLLVKYKRESAVAKSTLTIVKRILILTLETSAVTAAVAVALVTSFLVPSIAQPLGPSYYQKTAVYVALGYTIGKLYSNCFMILLNQRIYYETPGGITEDFGTLSVASHRTIPICGTNCSSDADQSKGQVSVVRFNETRGDDSANIEMDDLHGSKGGLSTSVFV